MLNSQNETIKQFYKSPFVKTLGDTTSPMLLASCGPPHEASQTRSVVVLDVQFASRIGGNRTKD